MAYIPSKNKRPGPPSTRPGKRSARPSFGSSPRPFTRNVSEAKKPRWVPRVGATATAKNFARPTGTSRPFSGGETRTPSPFPQKPPYRPNGPAPTRAPYVKPAFTAPVAKGRYGFLLKGDRGGAPARKPFAPKNSKPWEKQKPGVFRPSASPRTPKTQLARYAPKQATASWGPVATWYDKHLTGTDTYHEKVVLPNLLRLVEPQKGDLILDLASGQGFVAQALAKHGALVTGIDISPELVALAKKGSDATITFRVGSAEDLSGFKDGHFHKALIVLAIQNIEHAHKVMNEAARVVKEGGTFHIVMNHPSFRIPKHSNWGWDEKAGVQYRRVDQYISESREAIDMHPGMKDSPQTLSFHRPLQYYVKALVKAGFVIDRFEEWISHKESDSGPRAQAENRARKEIPLFLYIRARKL